MLQKNIRKLFRTVYNVDTRVIMHNEKMNFSFTMNHNGIDNCETLRYVN